MLGEDGFYAIKAQIAALQLTVEFPSFVSHSACCLLHRTEILDTQLGQVAEDIRKRLVVGILGSEGSLGSAGSLGSVDSLDSGESPGSGGTLDCLGSLGCLGILD